MEAARTGLTLALANLDLLAAAIAAALVLALGLRRANRRAVNPDALQGIDIRIAGGAVLAGRIVATMPAYHLYLSHPLDFLYINTGISFYGAVLGGALTIVVLGWRRNILRWPIVDSIAFYLPLGIGIFDLSCLLDGFCDGKPAPFPFGVPLPTFGTRCYTEMQAK